MRVHAGPCAHVNTVTWQRFALETTKTVDGHRAVLASVSSKLQDCQEKRLVPESSDQRHMARLLIHENSIFSPWNKREYGAELDMRTNCDPRRRVVQRTDCQNFPSSMQFMVNDLHGKQPSSVLARLNN